MTVELSRLAWFVLFARGSSHHFHRIRAGGVVGEEMFS